MCKKASVLKSEDGLPASCNLRLKASKWGLTRTQYKLEDVLTALPTKPRPLEGPIKYESEFSTPSRSGEAWILNVSSFGGVGSLPDLLSTGEFAFDGIAEPELTDGRR